MKDNLICNYLQISKIHQESNMTVSVIHSYLAGFGRAWRVRRKRHKRSRYFAATAGW